MPIELLEPVDYLVYRPGDHLSLPPDKVFAYVLAGNGVWKYAVSQRLEALIPLARSRVAGLPDLTPRVRPFPARLPGSLLKVILADARRRAWAQPCEAMYHLVVRGRCAQVVCPPQQADSAHLAYAGGGDPDIIADVHSHHELDAFFSAEDTRDEGGLRFYATIGHIFTAPAIRLRVGVYGDFYPVPVMTLFTDPGPFREVVHGPDD